MIDTVSDAFGGVKDVGKEIRKARGSWERGMIILERMAINGKGKREQLVIHHLVDYVTKRMQVKPYQGNVSLIQIPSRNDDALIASVDPHHPVDSPRFPYIPYL